MIGPLGGLSVPPRDNVIDPPSVEIIPPYSDVSQVLQNRPLGPCMSFYMKNKPTPVGKTIINKLQKDWYRQLLLSDKILLIGINPNFEDKHIWDPIIESHAVIGYVGRKTGYTRLMEKMGQTKVCHISESFENSMPAIDDFL
jgi:hypothetical protein